MILGATALGIEAPFPAQRPRVQPRATAGGSDRALQGYRVIAEAGQIREGTVRLGLAHPGIRLLEV
jgi:hypothetical protein